MWFLCFVTAVLHLIRHLKEATQGIHTENHCIKKLNATFFSARTWLLTRRRWKPKMPCHGDTWEQRLHLVNVRIIHMNCQTALCVMGQQCNVNHANMSNIVGNNGGQQGGHGS